MNNSQVACYYPDEPRIHLRVIISDGHVNQIDLPLNTLNISRQHFCPEDFLWFYLIEPQSILFTYYDFRNEEPSLNEFYDETGVILSYSGEILSKFPIGRGYPLNETITISLLPQGGFMRAYLWPNNTISWTTFSSPVNGIVTKLAEGIFYVPRSQEVFVQYYPFLLLDGGYGCAIVTNSSLPQLIPANATRNEIFSTDEVAWTVYAILLRGCTKELNELSILYQTSKSWDNVSIGPCRVALDGSGYGCFITPSLNGSPPFIYSIRFISEGAVISFQKLRAPTETNYTMFDFYNVFAGGYIVIGKIGQQRIGDLYNTSGSKINTVKISQRKVHINIFPCNNSIWYAGFFSNDPKTWELISIPLQKLLKFDEKYSNPNILSTYPAINQVIPLRTTLISINYNSKVSLGTGNITIYQSIGEKLFLRQQTSSPSIQYMSNGSTKVSIDVFRSTFNRPGQSYSVVVDTNFVQRFQNNEPLFGIGPTIWHFKTENKKGKLPSDDASGLLRLSANGTIAFKKAYSHRGFSILQDFSDQIADIIPISRSRIKFRDAYQPDPHTNPSKILLRVYLIGKSEPDIPNVIEDIRNLLANKDYNQLSRENYTSWLDNTYPFVITDDIWARYKIAILLAGAIFLTVLFSYIYAIRRNKDAKNFVIINITLIAQDFIFDILFVLQNGKDFKELFIPSVLTLIMPIFFNTCFALFIMFSENSKEDKFNDWLRKYPQVAAFFTILSCVDIEVLTILSSRLGGLNIFAAVFSTGAESMIFWASFLNFLIEDVPQFIIRVFYWKKNITYTILPNIALISSGISLLTTFLGKIYQATIRYGRKVNQGSGFLEKSTTITNEIEPEQEDITENENFLKKVPLNQKV
ncbi:hypothetical protein G9A89_023113 [Geosiphon pyriformis]|nr:hypothetical protein G9A89_023113 [Geosiphon pyriformis]